MAIPTPVSRLRRNIPVIAAMLAILAASAYLRYANLATNPGWDLDEGYNINIAWNLSQGRLQMYATSFAFVQHPPLFYLILAPLFSIFGADIAVLRGLTATYGVLTTGLVYLVGKDLVSQRIGLLASALFAIYPVAIMHNRWGYSYNQLMLVSLLVVYFGWRSIRLEASDPRKSLLLAGIFAGIGMVSDQEGVALILGVFFLAWFVGRRHFAWAAFGCLAPPVAYAIGMLSVVPSEFLFDWAHNLGRVTGGSLLAQPLTMSIKYQTFLEFDYWIPLGLLGLFLLPATRAKTLTLAFFVLMLTTVLIIRPVNPFFRTAIPVLPFVCLGLASTVDRGGGHVYEWAKDAVSGAFSQTVSRLAAIVIVFLAIFAPLAAVAVLDVVEVQTSFRTGIDDFLVKAPDDALAASRVVNDLGSPRDVALVSPNSSWLYSMQTADLLQAVAAEGKGTAFYPDNMPDSRFAYSPRLGDARFVVLDRFSELWSKEMPEEARIVRDVRANWQEVFRSGEYVVYQNPRR